MSKKKILLAVCGMSPQIVTETLYALVVNKQWIPDEVRLLSTAEGCQRASMELLHPDRAHFAAFCQEWLPEGQQIHFDESCLYTFAHEDQALEDIRTLEDSAWVADQIARQVWALTRDDDTEIHASIAGGRKTMGFLLGYAMSLYGRSQDRLSHVLVSEGYEGLTGKDGFYYPTRASRIINDRNGKPWDTSLATVDLHEIPILHLRHRLPKNMQQQPASFSSLVEVMNLDGEAAQIDIIWKDAPGSKKVGELFCQGIKVEMSELNLAFYTYVVAQSQAEGLAVLAQINQVDFLKIKQFALDYLQISEGADELHRQQYADYQAGDMAFVRDRKNEVNTALTARLGALGSRYQIKTRRNKGSYVEVENVTITGWEAQ